MEHHVVNGTAVCAVGGALCVAISAMGYLPWALAVILGGALLIPAIGLFQVAGLLKRQGDRITKLEQARSSSA